MCGLNGGSSAKLYPQSGSAYVHPTTKQCNYSYTHPSTKQCSWSPNLSSYATQSELNELRDLIDQTSTPTVVGSGSVDSRNSTINVPSCDYVELATYNTYDRLVGEGTCAKGGTMTLTLDNSSGTMVDFSLNSSGTKLNIDLSEGYIGGRITWVAYG